MRDALSPITWNWFVQRMGRPTTIQTASWNAAAQGHHLLAVASTGSGKTMAAFMVVLDRLFTKALSSGKLKVLYLSPLKALGTDIRENLTSPLQELQSLHPKAPHIQIGIRNGDTIASERRRQIQTPPEILVTTPESLNILLLSQGGRDMLSTIEVCIVDEIHALAPTRRGTLLTCALERLVELAGEYQRIGLTATVRHPQTMAAFLGGYQSSGEPRSVEILKPPSEKTIHIAVEPLAARPLGEPPDPDGFWKDIAKRLQEDVKTRQSTLIFIDSRKWAEKTARLINKDESEILAWAHHGSLSKDMRRLVETRLKEGKLRAVVATGSLELGIDIGKLDEVAMLGTPASPGTVLQRAGRAGHRPGEVSRARIYPVNPLDLLAAAVISRMAEEGHIESLRIPENPLDVLAQVILALCTEKGRKSQEILNLLRRTWSFHSLPESSFDSVLTMLRGRYADSRIPALRPQIYKDGDLLLARPGTRIRLYSGGGAIPDLGLYGVKAEGIKGSIGSLDEKFVWESQPGMVFHLGNSRWRILSIGDKDVMVRPTKAPVDTEPFWRGEASNRDEEYALRIAGLLDDAEEILSVSNNPADLEAYLAETWALDEAPKAQLAAFLAKQRRRTGAPLPGRGRIIAEASADPEAGGDPSTPSLFIHTFLGGRVNRPLALAMQAAWAQRSAVPCIPVITDESIAVTLAETDIKEYIGLLHTLDDPVPLIRRTLESTPFFGGRFREAAGRALLLSSSTPQRRRPLWMARQESRTLLETTASYPDFPLLAEVWRTCLNDEFALDALETLLSGIREGRIKVCLVHTNAPSPFAGSVVRRRLSQRMEKNVKDQGDPHLVSRLESQEIQRLTRKGALRPKIPQELLKRLDRRRRRVEPGYAPSSIEALKAWIDEREAFDLADWTETLKAVADDWGKKVPQITQAMEGFVEKLALGPDGAPWFICAEVAEEWREAFTPWGAGLANPLAAARLIAFWLAGRGPVEVPRMLGLFGIPLNSDLGAELLDVLTHREELGITPDRIAEGDGDVELCDNEGLEILLRWRRRRARNVESPLPAEAIPGFLAAHQGLAAPVQGEKGLAGVLGGLEAYAAAAGSWETSILPLRVKPYKSGELDALLRQEDIMWVGAGHKKLTFLTARGGWRYPAPGKTWDFEAEDTSKVFPSPGEAAMGFWDLMDRLGLDSAGTTAAIWKRVWTGWLTTDDPAVLRQGIASGFKATPSPGRGRASAGGLKGWKAGRPLSGRWYAPSYAQEPEDPLELNQLMRERIRLLLGRYGVLSRPLLEREIPPWRWSSLARILHLMELGDEVIGGRWFQSLPMPQFMHPESLALWRDGGRPGYPWYLEATDPASPCGLPGESQWPPRREGTWLAWNSAGQLTSILKYSSGQVETPIGIQPSDAVGALDMMAEFLTQRSVSPLHRLRIRRINGEEPRGEVAKVLTSAGFSPTGTGEWIRRSRPIGTP